MDSRKERQGRRGFKRHEGTKAQSKIVVVIVIVILIVILIVIELRRKEAKKMEHGQTGWTGFYFWEINHG